MKPYWLLGLIFLAACGPQPAPLPSPSAQATPGRLGPPRLLVAPLLAQTEPLKLGQVTKPASPLLSGTALAVGKGHLISFALAATGTPVTVQIEGGQAAAVTLEPGFWQEVQLLSTQEKLIFRFEGGPVFLAQPHYFDPESDATPNLLLISVDTLRRDFFTPEHMPRTFAAFQAGRIFDHVYSPTPWTLPAHSSMLTGLYPAIHGVRTPDLKLHSETTTLAEHLREIGYDTAAFTEGNYVSASFGLDQGFLHFFENPPSILASDPTEVSKLAGTLAALRGRKAASNGKPRFFFLHTYEVHCPYLPHDGIEDPEGLGQTQWLLDHDGKDVSPDQLAKLKALYGGEVAYADQQIGALVEELLQEGNWLIGLTADHGEEFGEHGGLLHAHTVYDETTAVPLALVGGSLKPGPVSHEQASLVDLVPTLLAALALPELASSQGRNLLGEPGESRSIFAESFYFGPQVAVEDPMVVGVWQDQYKLIQSRNFGKSEIFLFDLTQDPQEQHNLQEELVRERNATYGKIKTYLSLSAKEAAKVGDLSQEQIDAMKSLGYLK